MSMKLSEQLLLMAELTPSEAASAGMRIAAEEVVKLESENARLSARVAELEDEAKRLSLTSRVYPIPTNPVDIAAELWERRARAALIAEDNDNDPFRLGRESAWRDAAEYVEKALGIKPTEV